MDALLLKLIATLLIAFCLLGAAGCTHNAQANVDPQATAAPAVGTNGDSKQNSAQADPAPIDASRYQGAGGAAFEQALAQLVADLPQWDGQPFVELDGGEPTFTADEATTEAFERYGAFDELGRCTYAYACLGPETLATGPRENISHVKPSGWQRSEYDFIDGGILFTRSHLIARQLSGENDNELNLVTGTRYFNATGMIGFEEMTGDYIRSTGNHVLYRVVPIFVGDELVARGAWMEAMSMEDGGAGISFNVYVFNVQPGIEIDYATGDNWLAPDPEAVTGTTQGASSTSGSGNAAPNQPAFDCAYVLNTKSMRFHLPTCDGATSMSDKNRELSNASRDELLDLGYLPCGTCQP